MARPRNKIQNVRLQTWVAPRTLEKLRKMSSRAGVALGAAVDELVENTEQEEYGKIPKKRLAGRQKSMLVVSGEDRSPSNLSLPQ